MPYHDAVPSDPSIEQMKEVVCDKKVRPNLPEEWETFEVSFISNLLFILIVNDDIFPAIKNACQNNERMLVRECCGEAYLPEN